MTDPDPSSNTFQSDMGHTPARDEAEQGIETVRIQGGVFVEAVKATRMAMAMTDPSLPGNPIVFANESFLELSGYALDEVLGQQPYFMNGPGTDPADARRFREALEQDRDEVIQSVQYRKDGSRFVASLFLSAFKNSEGRTLHHFLSWGDLTRQVDAEDREAALLKAQAQLRESEARHAFLLTLSDTLRPVRDPSEVQAATLKLVAEHLDVMRVSYFAIDSDGDKFTLAASYERDAPPLTSHMKLSDYSLEMAEGYRQGRTFFIDDSEAAPSEAERAAYRSVGVRAAVGVPLVKSGHLLGVFGVNSARPREWTKGQIQLLEDVADRIWSAVERATGEAALRESEERQAFLLKLSDALRAEPSVDAVANRALQMLSRQMGLARCYVGIYRLEEDAGEFPYQVHDDGLPPLPAQVRLSDFPKALEVASDRTLVIDNVAQMDGLSEQDRANIEGLGLRALIASTLRKGERNPLWSIVAVSTHPRVWTQSEVLLVDEVTERTWAAVERARSESALRNSESRLRAMFDSVNQGFMEVEVEMSPEGRAIDWRYVALNPSFHRLTGMEDVTGRLASEVFPDREPEWAERYAQVVTTGGSMRFELPAAAFGRWFDINLVNVGGAGSRRIAVVYDDITERKRAEESLRKSEERQAFLLKLSDALRPLADPNEVQETALRVLGEHLAVNRAFFNFINEERDEYVINRTYADGVSPLTGEFRLSDIRWTAELAGSGQIVVLDDVETDPRVSKAERASYVAMEVAAGIGVPLIKDGRWVAGLGVHHATPRQWTSAEIDLISETAERTWAAVERAQAEAAAHKAEGRYLALFTAIDQGFCTIEVKFDEQQKAIDYRFLEVSPSFERETGIIEGAGRWMRDIAPEQDEFWFDTYGRVARTGEPARFESYSTPLNRWWSVYAFKIEGAARIAVLFHDITDRKRAEALIETSRQQFETLLNQAPLGVYLVDGDFAIRHVNPIAEPVFGDIAGGPVGRDFDEVIHILWDQDYADEVVRIFRHTLETGDPYVVAERAEHRSDRDVIEYYDWRIDRIILRDGQYGVVCYFRDVSAQVYARQEIEKGHQLARENEERLQLIVQNARDYAIFTMDPTGKVTGWYEGAEAVFGWSREEMEGKDGDIIYTTDDRKAGQPEAERAIAVETGKAPNVRWHVCKDGGRVFIEGVVTTLRDDIGQLTGFLKIGQDITARRRSEEHQKLLLEELQHRVRNILAMIQSIARRTLDTSESAEDYAMHLTGRIAAMARTQAVLTRSAGRHVQLEDIVREELLTVVAQEDQFWCEGPPVALPPKAAEVLTLAIHELATNSIKYGALSKPGGQLEISWDVIDRDRRSWLTFRWDESRVGKLEPFEREGFGTELITRRVPYELRGSGTIQPRPDGIEASIEFPLDASNSILETGTMERMQ